MNSHVFDKTIAPFAKLDGYIYCVQVGQDGPIKIGFTKNVPQRIANLQMCNPSQLNILFAAPALKEDEKQVQEAFDDIRIRGEWFLPHKDLLKEIEDMKRQEEEANRYAQKRKGLSTPAR